MVRQGGRLPDRTVARDLTRRRHFRDSFRTPQLADEIRRRLGWSDEVRDGWSVTWDGSFPRKGLSVLTAALAGVTTPWHALLVGGGPLEGELRRFAAVTPGPRAGRHGNSARRRFRNGSTPWRPVRAEPDHRAMARTVRPHVDRGDGVGCAGHRQRQRRDPARRWRCRSCWCPEGERCRRGLARSIVLLRDDDMRMRLAARPGARWRQSSLARRCAPAFGVLRVAATARANGGELTSLRVAVVADYLEEGWASMDLVAEMLDSIISVASIGESICRR